MADFTQAFQLMIVHEGGYVNDPDDPGGETYKGVARKIFSKWDGWTKVDTLKRQANFPANLEQGCRSPGRCFKLLQGLHSGTKSTEIKLPIKMSRVRFSILGSTRVAEQALRLRKW